MIESAQQETASGKFYGIIKMEYIKGCDLHTWMKTYEEGSHVSFCRYVIKSVLLAYDYALKYNIFHRDIKLENIMIDLDGTVKLIDWELASFCKYVISKAGTADYMAEEVLSNESYNCQKSDVWSLAVTLFILYFGKRPYGSILPSLMDNEIPYYGEYLTLIYNNKWKKYWKFFNTMYSFEREYDTHLCNFIEKCLQRNPTIRPSIDSLLFHDFFIEPCMERSKVLQLMKHVEPENLF